MHLVDFLSLRSTAAAGVSLGVTQRCPLHCGHCSTNSTMVSAQSPAEIYLRFVDSFTDALRPEVLSMSGGEALLRPDLVRKLADRCRAVGTRSAVLSGMFFAASKSIPRLIRGAIRAVDHFSASIDAFHEREVPRADVFRVLEEVLNAGTDVSLHIVGRDAEDPYLADLTAEVQQRFDGKVPMLVNAVASFGRAAQWLPDIAPRHVVADANPCSMAAWPVVGFDGTIVACGNDNAYEQSTPHLRLGHATTDDWATIRARCLDGAVLRAIRLLGPPYLAERHGAGRLDRGGYCETCLGLSNEPELESSARRIMTGSTIAAIEAEVAIMHKSAGALGFARRHGIPKYAELVTLGARA